MLLTSLYPKLGFQTYEEGPWCGSCTWIKVKCHLRIMRGCKRREEEVLGGYREEAWSKSSFEGGAAAWF